MRCLVPDVLPVRSSIPIDHTLESSWLGGGSCKQKTKRLSGVQISPGPNPACVKSNVCSPLARLMVSIRVYAYMSCWYLPETKAILLAWGDQAISPTNVPLFADTRCGLCPS